MHIIANLSIWMIEFVSVYIVCQEATVILFWDDSRILEQESTNLYLQALPMYSIVSPCYPPTTTFLMPPSRDSPGCVS